MGFETVIFPVGKVVETRETGNDVPS